MTIFSGMPHIRKIVTTYPSGKVKTESQEIATAWIHTREKKVEELPKYQPGEFLVKDYYVRDTTSHGVAETLRHSWTRYDGVRFEDNYSLSGYCTTVMLNLASVVEPNVNALKELSLQQAYNKLNRATWDSLVDLAEIGGTIDLVTGGLKLLSSPRHLPQLLKKTLDFVNDDRMWSKVRKSAKDLTWSDVSEAAKKGSKKAADLRLTYRYGILPTMYSIQDALELLKKKLSKAGNQIRTVRRRPDPVTSTKKRSIASPSCEIITKWESRVEAIVYYKRTADETLQSAMGLVPENLPNAFWETCKLSFVWDWLFNIGDFISTLKPKFGIEVLGTSYSERHMGEISVLQKFGTMEVGSLVTASPHTIIHNSFRRVANPALSYTPVFTKLDGMNLDRYLDAAALALQPVLNTSRKAKKALR